MRSAGSCCRPKLELNGGHGQQGTSTSSKRLERVDQLPPSRPPFLSKVYVRKRKWRQGVFEASTEEVQYLAPAPDEHGHWVVKDGQTPRITKLIMRQAELPESEAQWIATEKETVDALIIRRRIRDKSAVRRMEGGEERKDEEEEGRKQRSLIQRVKEEEMKLLMDEESSQVILDEMRILLKLKKAIEEPSQEEEVLQTKIVSPKEVCDQWEKWLPAVQSEIHSLIFEKMASKEVSEEEVKEMEKKAKENGRKVEYIPSKVVYTKKPLPGSAKLKVRWVACGNWEPKKEGEDNFSGGADIAALRIVIWFSAWNPWRALVLDIKTAFLNADLIQSDLI